MLIILNVLNIHSYCLSVFYCLSTYKQKINALYFFSETIFNFLLKDCSCRISLIKKYNFLLDKFNRVCPDFIYLGRSRTTKIPMGQTNVRLSSLESTFPRHENFGLFIAEKRQATRRILPFISIYILLYIKKNSQYY